MIFRVAAVSVMAGVTGLCWGQGATAIFTNVQSSPTSFIPGMGGLQFATGTATRFDRPYGSPDGQRWIFVGQYLDGATLRDVIVIGGGTSSVGSSTPVFYNQTTSFDGGITYQSFGTQLGINNAGQFAFGADTSAATTADNVVVRWNGASFDLMAREGTAAVGQGVGIGYGSTNDAVHILGNGNVGFRSATLTGATTQQVLYHLSSIGAGTIVAQTDVTSPGGQLTAPNQTIDNLTAGRFKSSTSGASTIYHGDLNGGTGTDLFMAVNGNVVAQEGSPLPGSGFLSNVSTLSGDNGAQHITESGDHYIIRGGNVDGIDWVLRDGIVVAQTDAPIFAGSTEMFDDAPFAATFFISTMDNNGNYVIGGTTNAADASANAVLVYNGTQVLIREGDPVDVDGDGLFDDDAFVSVFNNDDSFLSDDGIYYFNADLRNGAGTTIGQGYLWTAVNPVPEPASLAIVGLGLAILARRRAKR